MTRCKILKCVSAIVDAWKLWRHMKSFETWDRKVDGRCGWCFDGCSLICTMSTKWRRKRTMTINIFIQCGRQNFTIHSKGNFWSYCGRNRGSLWQRKRSCFYYMNRLIVNSNHRMKCSCLKWRIWIFMMNRNIEQQRNKLCHAWRCVNNRDRYNMTGSKESKDCNDRDVRRWNHIIETLENGHFRWWIWWWWLI